MKLVRGSMVRLALATALLASSSAQGEKPPGPLSDFKKGIQPILEKHCYDCHGRERTKGKVNLSSLTSWKDFESNPLLIEKMIEALDKNEMPPEEETQPSETQRKFILAELKKAFQNALAQGGTQPVIPLRLRRMNRFEYGNAVKDLFNLKSWVYSINDRIIRDHNNYFRPESREMPKVVSVGNRIMGLQQMLENRLLGVMAFPKDPPAENGFNNRGDHLSLSPVLMESFLDLSRSIVNAENFDKNCRVWDDLFQDPLNTEPRTPKGSIDVDQSVATRNSGLSISAWIRPKKTGDHWQTIVRREDSWRRQLLAIGRTGDTWGLWMGAGIAGQYQEFGASVDRKLLGDGEWHHVAGTFDGKQITLYLDGKQIGRKALVGKLEMQSTREMAVGAHGNEPFHGG
ncbi:MAG: DUF1587 domain-containing protein, partial [Akkermansiaceae bacterium]|nr:DUF1587 domain-containing protein [Akkermansiaceae bacterium]